MSDMAQLLPLLAEKLGTTSEHLWGVLMRQAHIQAWMLGVFFGLVAILVLTCIAFREKLLAVIEKARCGNSFVDDAVAFGVLLLPAALTMASILLIGDFLAAALNPEYWALKVILREVRQ